MILRLSIICLAAFLSTTAIGQRLQDWILLGDRAMEDNDPYGALRYFEKAMEIDSTKGLVQFKYAEALRQNHYYSKSAYYYWKVYRKERAKLFPESGAWLAAMYQQSGNYSRAKEIWRRVREQFKDQPDSYWYQKAVQSTRSCDLAELWMDEKVPFELEKLPDPINTDDSEFAGVFDSEGQLIFTSLRGKYDEKGRLLIDESAYRPTLFLADSAMAQIIPTPQEWKGATGIAVSEHIPAKALVFERDGQRTIEVSLPDNQTLTIPEVPDSAWYSHPAFGKLNGEEVIFFSSNREGGMGREDIWYITLSGEDRKPMNAGERINTPGSEITPFWNERDEKLVFASDWHHGFGGFDLFSAMAEEGRFGVPENLKQPYNSPANDLYWSFNTDLLKGTVTTNRIGSEVIGAAGCCNDIWLFEQAPKDVEDDIPEITTLEDLNEYLPVVLYFHNDEPDPRTRKDRTEQSYLETYYAYLDLLPEYQREYREGLELSQGDKAEEAMDDFFIEKVDQGIKDLELFTRLLEKELEKGRDIELTVKGFASPLAETDYNVHLTSRRISSLENYLRKYDRGALLPHIENQADSGGKLLLNPIPFGEYTASDVVTDNPNEADAVYGISAALERKIEIVSVQRAPQDTTVAEMRFTTEIADMGTISASDTLSFSFEFSASENLVIDSLTYDAEVITLSDEDALFENPKKTISGKLHPGNQTGKQNAVIAIFGNFAADKRELNITYEIK